MKINFENILFKKDFKTKKNVYLLYGNEESLILKIKEGIVGFFRKNNFGALDQQDSFLIDNSFPNMHLDSLFGEKKILIYKNPKILNLEVFSSIDSEKNLIIIEDSRIKSSDKIKKYFDASKDFGSIGCYKLNKESKKRIVDNFINKNELKLTKEAYWYFLENTDDNYKLLENELGKISLYDKKNLEVSDINNTLTEQISQDVVSLFYNITRQREGLVASAQKIISSPADSTYLAQRIKFFIDIFFKSKVANNKILSLPAYMFNEKNSLQKIYDKINLKKIIHIIKLLKKNELLQRKFPDLHKAISIRFLLNIKKVIS